MWLPEQVLVRADDMWVAFMILLERLAPDARTVILLREVFDADYDEPPNVIGKSEATCHPLCHPRGAAHAEAGSSGAPIPMRNSSCTRKPGAARSS